MRFSIFLVAFASACSSSNSLQQQTMPDLAMEPAMGDLATAAAPDLASKPIPTTGDPIMAADKTWTWVDFPDSRCDNGTPTGIGVNPNAASQDLIVFMMGGGACWDAFTCTRANTAVHGPFGKTQFESFAGGVAGSVFDRNDAKNPFKDYSMVFVPYCTGDIHGGDNVATYNNAPYFHKGHYNILLFLSRLGPTFPTPRKVVVSGSSAGGYGSSMNYPDFKTRWPNAKMYLLDDSGPVLRGAAIPTFYKDSWFTAWKIDELLEPQCGQECLDDLSIAVKTMAQKYPNDRLALLSSMRDVTIRGYLLLSPDKFETELKKLASEILDPSGVKYFFIPGESHTMLGAPGDFSQSGVELWEWMRRMVEDDASWASVKPY